MTYIDLIIIIYITYFLILGFYRGFFRQILDLVALILSFVLAFTFFDEVGRLIVSKTSISGNFGNVLGFFAIWFLVEVVYYLVFLVTYQKFPKSLLESKVNRWLGLFPAIVRGLISVWVLIGLISILPLPQSISNQLDTSFLGSKFKSSSKILERYIGNVFGGAIDETISFLTIKPESDEKVELGFTVTLGTVDATSEEEMLRLVNIERTTRGLKALSMDEKLREVARAHSKDMFSKGYFAHNNLEGESPFDRMDKAGIQYMLAGENLALAPDVDLAHKGLMDSPGHKANILTADFRKVGIGVIDGGRYGKMFSQEFTD